MDFSEAAVLEYLHDLRFQREQLLVLQQAEQRERLAMARIGNPKFESLKQKNENIADVTAKHDNMATEEDLEKLEESIYPTTETVEEWLDGLEHDSSEYFENEGEEEEKGRDENNSSLDYLFTENHSSSSSPPTTPAREMSPDALTKIAAAAAKFEQSFPEGDYKIIETSAMRLLCGFYSVINSMKAQYPSLPCPTQKELQDIFDANMKEYSEVFDMGNTNNFSVDQIAGVLYSWGLEKGVNLQIGYLEEGEAPMLVSHPAEDEEDILVVWIHNDSNWKGGIGHYSGMKSKGQIFGDEESEHDDF